MDTSYQPVLSRNCPKRVLFLLFGKRLPQAESESEKVTPANSGAHAQGDIVHIKYAEKTDDWGVLVGV